MSSFVLYSNKNRLNKLESSSKSELIEYLLQTDPYITRFPTRTWLVLKKGIQSLTHIQYAARPLDLSHA